MGRKTTIGKLEIRNARKSGRVFRSFIYIIPVVLMLVFEACQSESSSKASSDRKNLLTNPSFEEGREGWSWMDWSPHWVDFDISSQRAHSGEESAYFRIGAKGPMERQVEVHGVVQVLKPFQFPEMVRGWYLVENWERGSPKQYLQFVAIVWGGHAEYKNYQIRYILAGVTTPPHDMANVKYLFAPNCTETPKQNEWVYFEVPIKDEFLRHWGMVPMGYNKIDVFFEARYDTAPATGKKARADVYFDDLYIGGRG